ncbi:MAG: putative metal-binding motif-containing protein [Deltaproteobacteria bacterium]|nr:putative metal-binding motif-containing protein [Deltaproteobacteria bacterium]
MKPLIPWLSLLLVACKGDVESPPMLTITPTALDFGTAPVGGEAALDLVLANAGDGQIDVLSVQLTDGDPDIFDLDRDGSLALGDALSLIVTVTFTPEKEQVYLGLVQVRYDDIDGGGSATVSLTGEGSASEADNDADGYRVVDGDCDDNNASVNPGADEVCDGRDNDCSGAPGSDESDADGDSWLVCEGDCDDGDKSVYPDAKEICDDKDSDCDGVETDRDDADEDGWSICDGDCDDGDARARPGGVEVCDGADNDCDGGEDNIDADNDGHSVCSDAGDCDDNDRRAYPVVVDASASGEEDGTDTKPYNTLDEGLANLDGTCRTVWLAAGSYAVSLTVDGEEINLVGEGVDEVTLTTTAGSRHFEVTGGGLLGLTTLTLSGASAGTDGGSIRLVDSEAILDGVRLTGNSSATDGGGISATSSTLTLYASELLNNVAADDGGGISALSATVIDSGSVFLGNTGVRGGALVADSSTVTLSDSSFSQNTATDKGGGVAIIASSGFLIERGEFTLNTAVNGGGGLSFTNVAASSGSALRNSVIQDNNGGLVGGGLSVEGTQGRFDVVNNTFVANQASGQGAGIYVALGASGELEILSNLIFRAQGLSGLYIDNAAAHAVSYNTAYATSAGDSANFSGPFAAGTHENENEDPLFNTFSNDRDPQNDDLSLKSSSPAKDSGPPDAAYNDVDKTRNDRGHTGGPHSK